jgi:hypothetical protein
MRERQRMGQPGNQNQELRVKLCVCKLASMRYRRRKALRQSVITWSLFLVTWSFFLMFHVMTSVNFKKFHNFGSDRISVLEQVTSSINVCDTLGTAVSIATMKYQLTVTVECGEICPADMIHCPGLDIALVNKCPWNLFEN